MTKIEKLHNENISLFSQLKLLLGEQTDQDFKISLHHEFSKHLHSNNSQIAKIITLYFKNNDFQ